MLLNPCENRKSCSLSSHLTNVWLIASLNCPRKKPQMPTCYRWQKQLKRTRREKHSISSYLLTQSWANSECFGTHRAAESRIRWLSLLKKYDGRFLRSTPSC